MSWIDAAFAVIILVSAFIGLLRGFVREVFSLTTWVVAIWASLQHASLLATRLPASIEDSTLRLGIAFVAIFILVLILGGILGVLATRLIRGIGLRGTDGALGLLFGVLRGGVIVVVIVFLAALTAFTEEPWWQDSLSVPYAEKGLGLILERLPDSVREQLDTLRSDTTDTSI
jgi:membrane protein required for colicin V production